MSEFVDFRCVPQQSGGHRMVKTSNAKIHSHIADPFAVRGLKPLYKLRICKEQPTEMESYF